MKKNYFYLPLFLIFIFIVGCEKEQIPATIDEEQKFSIATVQKKDALEFTKRKVAKNIGKQSSLVLFYDQLRYDPILNSDELITVIPAQTNYENVDSRVLLLEINGNIEQVLYNVIPKSSSENIDDFNGRIIITDLDLNFLTGFKVENDYLTSRFVRKNELLKTTDCDNEIWEGDDMGCEQWLDEVPLKSTKYPSIIYIYSDSTMNPYDYDDSSPNEEQNYYYDGNGGGSTLYDSNNDEDEKVDETEAFKENDKINCTYIQLNKTTSIQEILNDFFGDDAIFDVTFDVVDNLDCNGNTNASGCTTDLGGNAYRIDIDLGYINDPTTPTIFLAQTLIHEAIHANLYAAVKKDDPTVTSDSQFEELYDKYREKNRWTHEYMALRYTGIMQQALKEVHPLLNDTRFLNEYGELDPSYWNWSKFYESISYRGLHLTEKGKEYYTENEEEISKYEEAAKADSKKEPNCN